MGGAPSSEVGPGLWAFVAFFVLAVALYLLMRSMFVRLRRMRLAEQDRAAAGTARESEILARARTVELPGRPEAGASGGRRSMEGEDGADEV